MIDLCVGNNEMRLTLDLCSLRFLVNLLIFRENILVDKGESDGQEVKFPAALSGVRSGQPAAIVLADCAPISKLPHRDERSDEERAHFPTKQIR